MWWQYLGDEADLPAIEGEGEGLPLHLRCCLCDGLELQPLWRGKVWKGAGGGEQSRMGVWVQLPPPCSLWVFFVCAMKMGNLLVAVSRVPLSPLWAVGCRSIPLHYHANRVSEVVAKCVVYIFPLPSPSLVSEDPFWRLPLQLDTPIFLYGNGQMSYAQQHPLLLHYH